MRLLLHLDHDILLGFLNLDILRLRALGTCLTLGSLRVAPSLLTLLLLLFAEVTVPLGDSVGPNGTMPAGVMVPGASLIPIGAAVTAGD